MNWNAEQIAAADRDQLHCFNYNHYVFARRQGSTFASQNENASTILSVDPRRAWHG